MCTRLARQDGHIAAQLKASLVVLEVRQRIAGEDEVVVVVVMVTVVAVLVLVTVCEVEADVPTLAAHCTYPILETSPVGTPQTGLVGRLRPQLHIAGVEFHIHMAPEVCCSAEVVLW